MVEKIYCLDDKQTYEIEITRSGENKQPCPKCSPDRKKKKAKVFSYDTSKEVGNCVHCGSRFVKYRPIQKQEEKEYVLPQVAVSDIDNARAQKFFDDRKISRQVLIDMKVFTATTWMPQFEKDVPVICFPYHHGDSIKNIKYRGPQKSFKMYKGAELIPYNVNALLSRPDTSQPILIVEGEMDVLAAMSSGYKNVISPPNGATKNSNNLEWLENYISWFDFHNEVLIGTDMDEAGLALRDELVRRIGIEKCKIVDWGPHKDCNEVLISEGSSIVLKMISEAKAVPVEGVFTIMDFKDELYQLYLDGMESGVGVGHHDLDNLLKWETGRMAVVTGVPGHGKSEWLDWVLCRLNVMHDWKIGFFSPENFPIYLHGSKLISKYLNQPFNTHNTSRAWFDKAVSHINDRFFFVAPEEDYSIDSILDRAKWLVKVKGIKVFVIDPYNRLEHQIPKNYTETQYISELLDKLTNFCRRMNILLVLVAHPKKMGKKDGVIEMPNLYDISGSSNFYNKTDYGVVVYRNSDENKRYKNEVTISVQKVKFKHLGEVGEVIMPYDYHTGRFSNDGENWLDDKPQQAVIKKVQGVDIDDDIPF